MRKPQLMLVEDEENIAFSLSYILERAGIDVSVVKDGEGVERRVRSMFPDVIILDLMLPNRSGFDILAALKSAKPTQSIPILVLSAKGQARDRERALSLGADAYMTKPFSNTEVVESVQAMLERKSAV